MDAIKSFGNWKNNAELIRDCANLGYLQDEWAICDLTYGLGRFWTEWKPKKLHASDLDPTRSPIGYSIDATDTPYPNTTFDAVVIDGPYKLNGTSTGKGVSSSDEDYGVERYERWQDRMQLIMEMMTEGHRILKPKGFMLVKSMDQVCSGKKRWQSIEFANHGIGLGMELVDQLYMPSYRAQPKGRRQLTSRINFSQMQVFRKR